MKEQTKEILDTIVNDIQTKSNMRDNLFHGVSEVQQHMTTRIRTLEWVLQLFDVAYGDACKACGEVLTEDLKCTNTLCEAFPF